jgi:hypothetical protein
MGQSMAVPLGPGAMTTVHHGITVAMEAAVAGEEAGPEGEDPMLENSNVSFFLLFFFTCLRLVPVSTAGRFFSFFSTQNKGKRFFGLPKN